MAKRAKQINLQVNTDAVQLNCPQEYRFGMHGTEWQLFAWAVHLFAEYDYSSISMRMIASRVGIRPPSIYNHFSSKEAFLKRIYDYVIHYSQLYLEDISAVLKRAETEPPLQVLQSTQFNYPGALQHLMSKMILICYKQMHADKLADTILTNLLIVVPKRYLSSLLRHMVALGRIEPLDIDAYVELHANNNYGSALRMFSSHTVDDEMWQRTFSVLFGMIKPTGR